MTKQGRLCNRGQPNRFKGLCLGKKNDATNPLGADGIV